MRRILQNRLLTIVIVLSIIFTIFIGLTATKRDNVSVFEGVVGNVLDPIQKYLYIGGQKVSDLFNFIGNISTISNENQELKKKNTELENRLADYEATKAENERLREMLDFEDENKSYKYLGANIIGKVTGSWDDVFIIDKGSNQGVGKNYPVVSSKGLIGQVTEVGPNWSKVLSIVDEVSRVSGIVNRTGDQGIIQGGPGTSGGKGCKMMYLPSDSKIQKGDIVVTSGISRFFPKNIIIGTVDNVESEQGGFVKSAVITPSVDFTRLQEVFVITNSISDEDYPAGEN